MVILKIFWDVKNYSILLCAFIGDKVIILLAHGYYTQK